jgi:hypothetical protein
MCQALHLIWIFPSSADKSISPAVSDGAKLYHRLPISWRVFPVHRLLVLMMCALAACSQPVATPGNVSEAAGPAPTPVYSKETGRLEQLVRDTNGDGVVDTRAYMQGRKLERVEVDRDHDGTFDRFEYYVDRPPERIDPTSAAGRVDVERVEEANGRGDRRITRREFYEKGELARVEEDSNADGQLERREVHDQGVLARIEMAFTRAGFPTRRLVYRRDGSIERVEIDPDGTGNWREPPADPKVPADKD